MIFPQRKNGGQATRRYKKSKILIMGAGIVITLSILAAFANYLAPFDPIALDMNSILQPPNSVHLLGTDYLGRDVFSRLIYGARISLIVGVGAMTLSMLFGVTLGLMAGFFGSWIDNLIMRITDTMLAFPSLILALTITAILGQSLFNVILALSITSMPNFSRIIRGEALSIMTRDYIRSAKVCSASNARIMLIHMLPNVMNLVLVQASLTIAYAILAEASMSFLGLGVPPPHPSWGMMLQSGYSYMGAAPWLAVAPGLIIFLAVLGFNFFGEGIEQNIGRIDEPS